MATNVATLVARLVADTSQFRTGMAQADTAVKKTSSGMTSMGKSMVGMFAAGAVLGGIAAVTKETMALEKAVAQTNAVLKSTGGVANVTAGDVRNLADAISKKSGMDDVAIQSASNLLLTFKNVRNEVGKGNAIFNRATQAAVDLEAKGFGPMAQMAKMLGKALNDPVAGMTAMTKAGVTFSAQQKETIKDLVATGDLLQAQKVILREVESQVGGSANAYGNTLAGSLGRLRESLEGVGVAFMQGVTPGLKSTTDGLTDLASGLEPVMKFLGEIPVVSQAISSESGWADDFYKDVLNWKKGANESGGAFTTMGTAISKAARAARELNQVTLETTNMQLGLHGSLLNVRSAAEEYQRVMGDAASTQLDMAQAEQHVAESIMSVASNMAQAKRPVEEQIAVLQTLAGTLAPGSELRANLDAYISTLVNGVPGAVSTDVLLNTDPAQAALDAWLAGNRSHEITVQVGAQFTGDLAGDILTSR